ncbi:helix-turn-helix domain-containing protein [Nocardia takedensis]|uniref:helix-turn-helix domain-containing protein n=1 Tax=Nocardia takedensis TaxID=259390 RepID=UPI003F7611E4
MSLDMRALFRARYCVADVIQRRRRTGEPIPDWMPRLHARLDAEIETAGSDLGTDRAATSAGSELVGTAEAARILGCSARWVRRLVADLDGQRAGHEWVFDRATVTDYAAARTGEPVERGSPTATAE